MKGCAHEHDAGAYVLGASGPAERLAFERHLAGCADCQDSVRRLAGLPGLLARVPVEVFAERGDPIPVPDTLLRGLLGRARRNQRRRTAVIAAAASVLVAGAAVLGTAAWTRESGAPLAQGATSAPSTSEPSSTSSPRHMRSVGSSATSGSLSGWVSLTPVGWGTRLDLTCRYAGDYGTPEQAASAYTVYVTHRDGTEQPLTSWQARAGRTARVSAGTAVAADQITEVSVRASDGTTVLRLGT